ncbi:hypothetical protein MAPG_06701 [Magnaporthiopsis poae ATCC 64411]|uniref:Uncharacterized protein n=1 Tax=Magnaporthiopsis poae (strain ATCC 64411 / 73-15) TaxID=644358 RepID=A0A0C4E2R1_MAGP6|nr:hypothetical protein MAPG_06701 [Magnaporthiopsis poae ATCC 64411]
MSAQTIRRAPSYKLRTKQSVGITGGTVDLRTPLRVRCDRTRRFCHGRSASASRSSCPLFAEQGRTRAPSWVSTGAVACNLSWGRLYTGGRQVAKHAHRVVRPKTTSSEALRLDWLRSVLQYIQSQPGWAEDRPLGPTGGQPRIEYKVEATRSRHVSPSPQVPSWLFFCLADKGMTAWSLLVLRDGMNRGGAKNKTKRTGPAAVLGLGKMTEKSLCRPTRAEDK